MSFLTKSLEKRIQELRTSIEAQSTELAAYEQVLALETGKPVEAVIAPSATAASAAPAPSHPAAPSSSSESPITVEFKGSRSEFVAAALKQRGSAGVTASEISAAFADRKVAISKNLVYNVLSVMFKRKLVRKADGRYFLAVAKAVTKAPPVAAKAVTKAPVAAKAVTKAPAAAKAAAKAPARAATPPATKKRRISEEGMRRIIAATKKRWALQRAAQGKAKGR